MAAPHGPQGPQGPQGHLDRLPDELLLGIAEQPSLSVRDLISLARASRRYHGIAISAAYKLHVKNEFGIASESCANSALIKRHCKNLC